MSGHGHQRGGRHEVGAGGLILCAIGLYALLRMLGGSGNLGALIPGGSPAHPTARAAQTAGTVVDVIDGDTLTVTTPAGRTRVRVLGINAPEVAHRGQAGECYGDEATRRLRELVSGKQVTLTADPTQADRDRYDRALRYVAVEGTPDVGGRLVDEGAAREYHTKAGPTQRSGDYAGRVEQARTAGRGMWSVCRA